MKIAFVGDSYCADGADKENAWPAMVADTIGAEILQTGFNGQGLYPPLELFLSDNFFQADYVVLCPTEPYRLHNNYNLPISPNWVEQLTKKNKNYWKEIKSGYYERKYKIPNSVLIKEIIPGAKAYYDHFIDDGCCADTVNIALVSLLDHLLKEHNKKVIWLPSFPQAMQYPYFYDKFISKQEYYNNVFERHYYIPESGPSSNIALTDVSYAELVHDNLSEEEIDYRTIRAVDDNDRRNHFNKENNIILAKVVLDIIEKDDFSPKAINMEEYFSHLDLSNTERIR